MLTEQNKTLIQRLFKATNEGDLAVLEGHPGFWQARRVIRQMHTMFANWQTVYTQQIAEDDKVFTYGAVQMTHFAPFAGIMPANARIILELFSLDRVIDGFVVEHNGVTTRIDLIRQLGSPRFAGWPRRILHPMAASQNEYVLVEVNKAVIAQLLEALSQGDAAVGARHDGIGALQEEFAAIRAAFPDLEITLTGQVAEGDLVGTRATLRGTHRGALYGFAATNTTISWNYFSLARIKDGTVVEHNGAAGWTTALKQIGGLPS